MTPEQLLLVALDYAARGAVFVLVFMLRYIFVLDKKFTLLEREAAHQAALAKIEHARRTAERGEIIATLAKHDEALKTHNDNVTNALADIRHLLARHESGP